VAGYEAFNTMDLSDKPSGLSARGEALWQSVVDTTELDYGAQVLLAEACRIADRLEQLHWILRGDDNRWIRLAEEAEFLANGAVSVDIIVDHVLMEARQQQLALRQILTTLGLGRAESKGNPEEDLMTRMQNMPVPKYVA
jgi:hypothetical protein